MREVGLPGAIQNHMGVAMLCQAGLAIGLVLVTNQRFPALAPKVSTIVLAAVAVFELVGPLGVRFALTKAGEVRLQDVEPAVLLD